MVHASETRPFVLIRQTNPINVDVMGSPFALTSGEELYTFQASGRRTPLGSWWKRAELKHRHHDHRPTPSGSTQFI